MAVTLQQIADLAGVSRGTVDRAINNRGRIKPEVEKKIKQIAKNLGYQPSRAGRALVMSKRNIKIGIILQLAHTPFMQDILSGLEAAKTEVERLGANVEIYKINGVNPTEVIYAMKEMRNNEFNGIALTPSQNNLLMQLIEEFSLKDNIPIITFNSDLSNTSRLCFIGQNSIKSGQTAAGLMGEITNGYGQIIIISGHEENLSLSQRATGFINELNATYPQICNLGIRYAYDDDWISEKITDEILINYPYLKGIYITGSGVLGVCNSLEKAHKTDTIKVIANDIITDNINLLKKGSINFLIGQDGYTQGYQSVMCLFNKLFDNEDPASPYYYTDIVIKNRYNI